MGESSDLADPFEYDETKGEIRAYGRRFTMIDLIGLCRHLDSLVGEKIAAVIAGSHGRETGKDDLSNIRLNHPDVTVEQLMEALRVGGALGGHGIAKLTMNEDEATPLSLEIHNPLIRGSKGTCVKLILSYWEGALSELLGKTLDATDITYEEAKDMLRCRFTVVGIPEAK